jgi:flagellum-specific ATP synthase
MDGKGPVVDAAPRPLSSPPVDPMDRPPIDLPLATGVRAIDALLSAGQGQRLGIFAAPGLGKSTLLAMMARHTEADVTVIGLVGERGREVRDFIDIQLGPQGMASSVVVCATSEESPLLRIRAAMVATVVAEYFRDQGRNVLLLIDSVTRLCQAQRQVGLAAGEPPTTKGYTPTVFTELPKLLERAGPGPVRPDGTTGGPITGRFTVLVDGDDHNEPIADAVRGILDGHIVMERAIAERGRYPAINVLKSISRLMPMCHTQQENQLVLRARAVLSLYQEMEELIRIGAYKPGADADVDEAVRLRPGLEALLTQDRDERSTIAESFAMLAEALT